MTDYEKTSNSDPVQGKIELVSTNVLTVYKVGPDNADVTFEASTTSTKIWNHYLIKFDTTSMTISF